MRLIVKLQQKGRKLMSKVVYDFKSYEEAIDFFKDKLKNVKPNLDPDKSVLDEPSIVTIKVDQNGVGSKQFRIFNVDQEDVYDVLFLEKPVVIKK